MEHLPPTGWADVATKRDLDAMDFKLDAVASKIETGLERGLRGMERELRLLTWRVMLAMLTLVSLAVAAARTSASPAASSDRHVRLAEVCGSTGVACNDQTFCSRAAHVPAKGT